MWILNKHPQAEGNLAKHKDIRMLTVTQHGTCGDGVSNDTAAIQAAIDAAAAHGGGTVVVPPGRYRIGTVFLRGPALAGFQGGGAVRSQDSVWPPGNSGGGAAAGGGRDAFIP